MKLRIYYEDTDAGGIVYHANYLKFCERARSEFFFQKGLTPVIDGAHFVVRKMECDFIASAKFGDIIEVTTKIIEIKKSSLRIGHAIFRNDEVLFKTDVLLVLVKDGKLQRLNANIIDGLQKIFE